MTLILLQCHHVVPNKSTLHLTSTLGYNDPSLNVKWQFFAKKSLKDLVNLYGRFHPKKVHLVGWVLFCQSNQNKVGSSVWLWHISFSCWWKTQFSNSLWMSNSLGSGLIFQWIKAQKLVPTYSKPAWISYSESGLSLTSGRITKNWQKY